MNEKIEKQRPTRYSQELRNALERLGIRVLTEVCDKHKCVDLAIPSARIDIEVDGEHHLTDAYQILKDLSRAHFSEKLGYATIHIPNHELKRNLGGIASAIAEASKLREELIHKHGRN